MVSTARQLHKIKSYYYIRKKTDSLRRILLRVSKELANVANWIRDPSLYIIERLRNYERNANGAN